MIAMTLEQDFKMPQQERRSWHHTVVVIPELYATGLVYTAPILEIIWAPISSPETPDGLNRTHGNQLPVNLQVSAKSCHDSLVQGLLQTYDRSKMRSPTEAREYLG